MPQVLRFCGETAVGTGLRLGSIGGEMAARGYRVTGFDLNRPSLDYLRRRLARRGFSATTCSRPTWPISAFPPTGGRRLLYRRYVSPPVERTVGPAALKCIAESLRPGGIYILGFHLLPMDASEEDIERWTERQGGTQVTVTLRVLATDRRRRIERLRLSLLARTRAKEVRLRRRVHIPHVYDRSIPPAPGECAIVADLRRLRLLVRNRQSPGTERRSGRYGVRLAKMSLLTYRYVGSWLQENRLLTI